jgi:hydroxyacylglutathione hydrolase
MEFKQFYLGCLAHASYLIGDEGECAIVDPQRDVDQYIAEADQRGLVIRHVIETHLHADFVSGHVELASRTGATIYIGQRAEALFDHQSVQDGDELRMGAVVLRFLETPGHTPESLCILVSDLDGSDQPSMVLTGDTLFIGDVGRPDLAGSRGFSPEQMAGMMYDSLRQKLMPLDDDVEVFPAHGAGSACGKNISSALSCTIGRQKETNHALQSMQKDAFVSMLTQGLGAPPPYFSHSAQLNRSGARALDELGEVPALSPEEFEQLLVDGALALDVRDSAEFGAGHVAGAIHIGLVGNLAPWVGALVPLDVPLVLVTSDDAQVGEALLRLARVGFESVRGALKGGVQAWRASGRALATVPQLSVDELAGQRGEGRAVLDVRGPGEFEGGHVPGAQNVPLPELERRIDELDPTTALAVICATGYRSSAATSLLLRHGFSALSNVVGGTAGWVDAGHAVDSAVPSA